MRTISKCLLAVCAVLLLNAATAVADPRQLEVFTSFEPPDTGPVFGSEPVVANFSGGSARTIGVTSFYHSGLFSWEVPAGVTTVVEFSTPAQIVEFFALDTGTIDASVAAFDAGEELIDELFLTNSFSSPSGDFSNPLQFADAIAKLEFRNPGSGSAWIDDFGFSPVTASELPGDYNQDGGVDAADYTVWRDSLGQSGPDLAADGNGDDVINAADYDIWKSNFGQTVGSGAETALWGNIHAAVPEPASLALMLLTATALIIYSTREKARRPTSTTWGVCLRTALPKDAICPR